MPKPHTLLALSTILALVACTAYFCNSPANEEPSYLNLNDTVKYVGMENCKQCHADIYRTFIETGMGKSFDLATHQKSSARFDHTVVHDTLLNFSYYPYWEKDSLKIMEFRLKGKDTAYKRIETVRYIIGSGQHTNSHLIEKNGFLFQAPLTYYTQKGTWDLPPGFENGASSRFSRLIGIECMSCHNSLPGFVAGSENKYDTVPLGIGCERCHGPGEIHVKEKRAGRVVDITQTIDRTIVNPAKLSPDLQFDVCSRCHLQGNAVLKDGKTFTDFRPGMQLSAVMDVFMPKYSGDDKNFIMASHVERLKMSKCFLRSKEKGDASKSKNDLFPYKSVLTCVSCHNPHISVKQTGVEQYNTACRNCHSAKEKQCSAPTTARNEQQDNCTGCHMPRSGTTDIPHVISTDHYIRKPEKNQVSEAVKRFLGIRCINESQVENKYIAQGYLQYYEKFKKDPAMLDSASFYLAKEPDHSKNFSAWLHLYFIQGRWQELIQLHEKTRRAGSQDAYFKKADKTTALAWDAYRIGEAYYNLGKLEQALPYFDMAVRLSPYNFEFRNKQGATLLAQGKYAEAKRVFQELINKNADYPPAWSNLGYAGLLLNHDDKQAEIMYDKALSLSPDYKQALLNKVGLFIYRQDLASARKVLNEMLHSDPNNQEAKALLQKISSFKS